MSQLVQLWFDGEPRLDLDAATEILRQRLGSAIDVRDTEHGRAFVHRAHAAVQKDPSAAQKEDVAAATGTTIIARIDEVFDAASCESEVKQSWRCPQAAALLEGGLGSYAIAEAPAGMLAPATRVELFHATLEAAVLSSNAKALVCRSSMQVLDRQTYIDDLEFPALQRAGALNVRMYRVAETEAARESTLMDTFGLQALGLHDVQCHFVDLEAEDVARVLFNTAYFLIEKGAIIEEEHTLGGVEAGQKWTCRFVQSTASPTRRILDLDPGASFAAVRRDDPSEPE